MTTRKTTGDLLEEAKNVLMYQIEMAADENPHPRAAKCVQMISDLMISLARPVEDDLEGPLAVPADEIIADPRAWLKRLYAGILRRIDSDSFELGAFLK